MNITSTSDMTSLVPGITGSGQNGFGTFINLGRNAPDPWTAYNGCIGDVFVYRVALIEAERQQVETIVMSKFTPIPPSRPRWSSIRPQATRPSPSTPCPA